MLKRQAESRYWVLTCEHASKRIPREYRSLGLSRAELSDHIGWDIGARDVQRELSRLLGAPAAWSKVSRLLVDANRLPHEPSLIPEVSDGVSVPGNAGISDRERELRLSNFHAPYHQRVDRMVARAKRTAPGRVHLLSIHSFTPVMTGTAREFDIGVLFDAHVPLARAFGRALERTGFRVRHNEPYSGYDGLIYAPKRHGDAHEIPYVELEINNALIRDEKAARGVARRVARALRAMR